jgi:hypothetical protein
MRERLLRDALLDAPLPDAEAARERGLRAALVAYSASPPALRRRSPLRRRPLQAALVGALVLVLISPAGAAVRGWLGDAVDVGGGGEGAPALTSLPGSGRLLVQSAQGPWVVGEDGSQRLLGAYSQATWSPRGLYVAAVEGRRLAALEPDGDPRWTLSRPAPVTDPAWSPDGFRIAYLSGGDLRLVAGDGTGDRLLARDVAPVVPAWRPGTPRRLAFAAPGGHVLVAEPDGAASARLLFGAGRRPLSLAWSVDGSRLLVATRTRIFLLDPRGGIVRDWPVPDGLRLQSAALAPDGRSIAVVLRSAPARRGELLLLGEGSARRRLFAGPGRFGDTLFSPDGRRLLLAWPSADEWVLLDLRRPGRVRAVGDIAFRFAPGATSPAAFPRLAGWCCPLLSGR